MSKESPIINILTYRLDFDLANQLYGEYQSRHKDALYLIENYKTYLPLKRDLKTVELLLALSIFRKRVISNLDAAVKFYGKISRLSNADSIQMGKFNLDNLEKNKLLGITINYTKLIEKYDIPDWIMEYNETRDFLKNIIALKAIIKDKKKTNGKGNKSIGDFESDVPF